MFAYVSINEGEATRSIYAGNHRTRRPPGPINMTELFELDGSLKVGLKEGLGEDYHVLEWPIWELYVTDDRATWLPV